jgi:hypothetical protein
MRKLLSFKKGELGGPPYYNQKKKKKKKKTHWILLSLKRGELGELIIFSIRMVYKQ